MRTFWVEINENLEFTWVLSATGTCFAKCDMAVSLLVFSVALSLTSSAFAQTALLTSHGDNARSAANTNETLLTPRDVNKNDFGKLFSVPVDYEVLAQPLYVPNVTINADPYLGTVHNVVYVATQMDSFYAIRCRQRHAALVSKRGGSGWCAGDRAVSALQWHGKFNYEGIVGTPVIDLNASPGTIYLVAKSVFNGTVFHYLHAVDITTGLDLVPPVALAASSISKKGT